jgi:predicted Zn-dependent peptidase
MIKNINSYNIEYRETVLPSGSKIYSFIKKNSPIYFRIFFKAGSILDNDKKGLAHFVEHMLLTGTELYKNKNILNEKISELGAKRNATTGNNKIYLTFDIAEEEDFLPILDIFDQIINHPTFNIEDIENERKVILSEYTKRYSNPELHIYELENSLILQNTSIEIPPIGTPDTIKKITREDILHYYENNIKNGKVSYFIFGDFNFDKIIKKIEEINKNRKGIEKNISKINLFEDKKEIIEKQENIKQTYLCLTQSIEKRIINKNIVKIICYIFGQGNTSRLNKILRNEKGLVYNINMSLTDEPEYSFISISTNCNLENENKVIEIIRNEFDILLKNKVSQKELEIAKRSLLREIKFNYELGSYWVNKNNMSNIIFDDFITIDEQIKEIKKININDINNFIDSFIEKNNLLISMITKK